MSLPNRPGIIRRTLRIAERQIGTPYVWGGSAPGGFDCSGLLYYSYNQAGYHGLGRTTYQMIKQGIPVSENHLQPGDAVFPEPGHVGIYVGHGMVLEAPHTGDHVKLMPLHDFGFLTARRYINGGGGVIPPRGIGGITPSGLPIPSANPHDRVPRGGAFRSSAALAVLLGIHAPTPTLAGRQPFQTPQTTLQSLQPPQPLPVAPSLPGLPARLLQANRTAETSLDATRRQLLGGV